MSNDIKKQKKIDYIPEDRSLCARCIFFKKCPYDYTCPSFVRLMKYEVENGEL